MAKLMLKWFECKAETDDFWGHDSPYFVFLVGHRGGEPHIHVTEKPRWDDNVEANRKRWKANEVIVQNFEPANMVVLIALCERDDGRDIDKDGKTKIWRAVKGAWEAWGNQTDTLPTIWQHVRAPFYNAVSDAMTNDDIIRVLPLKITSGEVTMKFASDGADYRVTFAVV